MHDTKTEKSLKKLTVNDNEIVYRNIIENLVLFGLLGLLIILMLCL